MKTGFPLQSSANRSILNISFILCCPAVDRERDKINTDYEINQKKGKIEMPSDYYTFHWTPFPPFIYCVLTY